MDADFWHDKWETQNIAFHQTAGNPLLVAHFDALQLDKNARVFVPLCGKTGDIAWLLAQGCRVVGAELSEIAITQLFAELDVVPVITDLGPLKRYCATGIDIFVGDIFALTAEMLGVVDAVYDRAALVALPDGMRAGYADHVTTITQTARQCVITFTYEQALMNGPPFSVSQAVVRALYEDAYTVTELFTQTFPGGFRGGVPATETVWLLTDQS